MREIFPNIIKKIINKKNHTKTEGEIEEEFDAAAFESQVKAVLSELRKINAALEPLFTVKTQLEKRMQPLFNARKKLENEETRLRETAP